VGRFVIALSVVCITCVIIKKGKEYNKELEKLIGKNIIYIYRKYHW